MTNENLTITNIGRVTEHHPVQATYTFTLQNFRITDTRSVHNDTDFVSVAVVVGKNPPVTLPVKSMGDVNNGTHAVNLSLPVHLSPTDTVVFSYSIVNTGFDKNKVEQALRTAMEAASSKAATAVGGIAGSAVGGPVGGGLAAIGTKAAGWLIGKFENVIFANCDGTVAAADHAFTAAQLASATANGHVLTQTDDNKGSDSPTGCGSNSRYFVTWSISGHPA